MAAKKSTPKKFKQATRDAKSAAKKTFSGKPQARLKDPLAKLELVDKEALKEVSKEAKGGFITDDRGNKIQTKPTETAYERIARERKAALAKYRAQVEAEDGPKPAAKEKPKAKAKPAVKKTTAKKSAPAAKPAVKKVAVPADKKMTRAERSAANKAAHAAKRPAELARLKAAKVAARTGTGVAAGGELKTAAQVDAYKKAVASGKSKGEAIRIAQNTGSSKAVATTSKTSTPKTGKDVAIRSKGTVSTTTKATGTVSKPEAGKVVNKGGKLSKWAKIGKKLVLIPLAVEAGSIIKGSTEKDFREIQRLENKLAALQGKAPKYKNMGSNKNVGESLKADFANIAANMTGVVGKTRRERMDELNAKIAKEEAKKAKRIAAQRAAKPGISPAGARSSSKINNTFKPVVPSTGGAGGAGGAGGSSGGGKSSGATQGSTYVVKSGDTLSKIAKDAGVSLKDLLDNNKKFTSVPKYKQGNMIWSGTTVKIPKK